MESTMFKEIEDVTWSDHKDLTIKEQKEQKYRSIVREQGLVQTIIVLRQ